MRSGERRGWVRGVGTDPGEDQIHRMEIRTLRTRGPVVRTETSTNDMNRQVIVTTRSFMILYGVTQWSHSLWTGVTHHRQDGGGLLYHLYRLSNYPGNDTGDHLRTWETVSRTFKCPRSPNLDRLFLRGFLYNSHYLSFLSELRWEKKTLS